MKGKKILPNHGEWWTSNAIHQMVFFAFAMYNSIKSRSSRLHMCELSTSLRFFMHHIVNTHLAFTWFPTENSFFFSCFHSSTAIAFASNLAVKNPRIVLIFSQELRIKLKTHWVQVSLKEEQTLLFNSNLAVWYAYVIRRRSWYSRHPIDRSPNYFALSRRTLQFICFICR